MMVLTALAFLIFGFQGIESITKAWCKFSVFDFFSLSGFVLFSGEPVRCPTGHDYFVSSPSPQSPYTSDTGSVVRMPFERPAPSGFVEVLQPMETVVGDYVYFTKRLFLNHIYKYEQIRYGPQTIYEDIDTYTSWEW